MPTVADEGEMFVKRFGSGPEHAVTKADRPVAPGAGIVGTAMGQSVSHLLEPSRVNRPMIQKIQSDDPTHLFPLDES